jgi:hypothetical protein
LVVVTDERDLTVTRTHQEPDQQHMLVSVASISAIRRL